MSTPKKTYTALYHYDPLDRLTSTHASQRFYRDTRIATEINSERTTSFFEHQSLPLAERHLGEAVTLLATDLQTSVLHSINSTHHQPQAYSPYGHRPAQNVLLSVLGFNSELPDPVTGHYLLGQGHRAYNPVLMRFNRPDTLSPFGKGGINAYAYCSNNPITRIDPTAESWITKIYGKIPETLLHLSNNGLPDSFYDVNKYALDKALNKYNHADKITKTTKYIKEINAHIALKQHNLNKKILPLLSYATTHSEKNIATATSQTQKLNYKLESNLSKTEDFRSYLQLTEDYLKNLTTTPTDISTARANIRRESPTTPIATRNSGDRH